MFLLIIFTPVNATEVYINSVEIDTETYRQCPWNIFQVRTDADTTSDDICSDITYGYTISSLFNGISTFDYPDNVETVCGTGYHGTQSTFSNQPLSNPMLDIDHTMGLFGCDSIVITGNSIVDSYVQSDELPDGKNEGDFGNLFSNGDVLVSDQSSVYGSIYAATVAIKDNSTVTGTTELGDYGFENGQAAMSEIAAVVSVQNHNQTIGLDKTDQEPFNDATSLQFHLTGNTELTLSSGVYYFTSFEISGQSRLNITGTVMIYCQGPVYVSGQSVINEGGDPKDLAIYSLSDKIDVSGSSRISAELFAPVDDLVVSGGSTINGALFGKRLFIQGQSTIHFNETDVQRKLTFAVVSIYDQTGTLIEEKIGPPSAVRPVIMGWTIDVDPVTGELVQTMSLPDNDGKEEKEIIPIMFKGYSDYGLLMEIAIFQRTVVDVGPTGNIWNRLLKVWTGSEWIDLNFHRTWIYGWTLGKNVLEYPWNYDLRADEQHSQPWKYMPTFFDDKHRYDMYQPAQTCSSGQPYSRCYWKRLERMLSDALNRGVYIQFDLFEGSIPPIHWDVNPWNPVNQTQCTPNEITNGDTDFDEQFYSAATDVPNYFNLRVQQGALVDNFVKHSAMYPNVFYFIMNEPHMKSNEGYYDSLSGTYKNTAVVWHDLVANWVYQSWNATPGHSQNLKLGINIFPDSGDNCGVAANTNHRQIVERFFDGKSGSGDEQYVGTIYPNLYKAVSYHTPSYKDVFVPGCWDCSDDISGLKFFHKTLFQDQGRGKMCLVDTDGDGKTYCRTTQSILYDWAYHSFGTVGGMRVHFTSKAICNDPNYICPRSYELGIFDEIPLMERIDQAYKDAGL